MTKEKRIHTPLTDDVITDLHTGNTLLISGVIYTARDAAHKRLIELINKGENLPFDLQGQVIYYVGPTPPKPGIPIGSAGPTTSGRMDAYSSRLMAAGLKGMIGKGMRSAAVKEAIKKHGALYMAAIGGTGALISKSIKKSDTVAYKELGAEALLRIEVEDFPATVINDIYGGDLYEEGKAKYARAEEKP